MENLSECVDFRFTVVPKGNPVLIFINWLKKKKSNKNYNSCGFSSILTKTLTENSKNLKTLSASGKWRQRLDESIFWVLSRYYLIKADQFQEITFKKNCL